MGDTMNSSGILNLLQVEADILKYYGELEKREVMRQYGQEFVNIVNLIKSSIKRQNEILDTLEIRDLSDICNGNLECYLKQFYNQADVDAIMIRTSTICSDKLISTNSDKYTILGKTQMEVMSIVLEELININLSFIDEYLEQIDDINSRKILCSFKYDLIYIANTTSENDLIEKYYHTDNSIYLISNLKARLKQIPLSYIDERKRELANMIFDSYGTKIFMQIDPMDITEYNLCDAGLLKSSSRIRSALLFLNEKDFIEMLNKLGINQDNPWYDVFLNDRSRHKIVSLGFNKIK